MVDLTEEPLKHTLVVANQTVGGRRADRDARSAARPSRRTGSRSSAPRTAPDEAAEAAQERLDRHAARAAPGGPRRPGYVTHPDPLTAIVNAHQFDPADEIVISTLPSYRSNWLRGDLSNRARARHRRAGRARDQRRPERPGRTLTAGRPRWNPPASPTPHGSRTDPPEANRSSRVHPQLLGVLLFIISEAMLFGSFFTAMFFVRVVAELAVPAGIRSTSRSPSRPSTPRSWSPRAARCTTRCTRSSRATASA